MKNAKMIIGMAATLFCLILVGSILTQENERESSDSVFAVERTVSPSSNQLYLNANWGVNGKQGAEASIEDLENAYYYKMIEDQSWQNKNQPSCNC